MFHHSDQHHSSHGMNLFAWISANVASIVGVLALDMHSPWLDWSPVADFVLKMLIGQSILALNGIKIYHLLRDKRRKKAQQHDDE